MERRGSLLRVRRRLGDLQWIRSWSMKELYNSNRPSDGVATHVHEWAWLLRCDPRTPNSGRLSQAPGEEALRSIPVRRTGRAVSTRPLFMVVSAMEQRWYNPITFRTSEDCCDHLQKIIFPLGGSASGRLHPSSELMIS